MSKRCPAMNFLDWRRTDRSSRLVQDRQKRESEAEHWSLICKPDGTLLWVTAMHIVPPGREIPLMAMACFTDALYLLRSGSEAVQLAFKELSRPTAGCHSRIFRESKNY
jgi:hypothetical protein